MVGAVIIGGRMEVPQVEQGQACSFVVVCRGSLVNGLGRAWCIELIFGP